MRNSFYILPILTLGLVNMAQAYNVGEQCDRGLIPDHNTIKLSQVQDVCSNNPSTLVTSVKLQITKYLCLFYSDLECLKRVSSFEAKYSKSSNSSNYEPDFERMVGSRYVNSWLNGNPQASFVHPYINRPGFHQSDDDTTLGSALVGLISNVIPGAVGNLISGLSSLGSGMGSPETSSRTMGANSEMGSCANANANKINGTIDGRSCNPNYNFNSSSVADFLKQTPNTQANYLKCGDTCRYYGSMAGVIASMNNLILKNSFPVFDKTPVCLSGGRVSFSFEARDYQSGATVTPSAVAWNGLMTQNRQRIHYKNASEDVGITGAFLKWEVVGDLSMRQQTTATVSPAYTLGENTVTVRSNGGQTRAPMDSNPPRTTPYEHPAVTGNTFQNPSFSVGSYGVYSKPGPLYSNVDPAIQGMSLATAVVSGCCTVPDPGRRDCLARLPTVESYRYQELKDPPLNYESRSVTK